MYTNFTAKRVELVSQPFTTKSQSRADRIKRVCLWLKLATIILFTSSCIQPKLDTHWMMEYRKLEYKTRMQLQAKDKEIRRLRNVIQQLKRLNNDSRQSLLSEMKHQVETLSKWIDNKTTSFPLSNALVKMALSSDGKTDDIFSGASESSSNQSSLERPPRHHYKQKAAFESCNQHNANASTIDDRSNTTEVPTYNLKDLSGSLFQHFSVNVSNPATAVESDTSDIPRLPVQATEFMADLSWQSDLGSDKEYPTKPTPNSDANGHDRKCSQQVPAVTHTGFDSANQRGKFMTHITGVTHNSLTSHNVVVLPTIDESHTPTVKSNTASPTSSPYAPKSTSILSYGKESSPKPLPHQKAEQESTEEFRAVFRKIRGKYPPTI